MPGLAVIVPTRGRPENIWKVISAWDFTNAWDHADLFLVVDADDPEIGGYRAILGEDDTLSVELVVMPEWMPMVHKLNKVAVNLAEQRTYFALGFAGDDHLPQTINWVAKYLRALGELGSGMVYGDDGYQGRKLSTEWAITADVVRALGRMVPAPVEHMYCDNAMMDLFTAAGALRHLPEIRIEHMHPVAGKAPTDAQYQRVNHRDQFAKDRTAYSRWKLDQMAADVRTVRALRPGAPEFRPEMTPTRRNPGSGPRRVQPHRGRQTSGPSKGATTVPRNSPFPYQFKNVRGATPDDIGLTLADFAAQVSTEHEIVELGVFQGRTAILMAWGASKGNGAHVTAVDAWDLPGNTYAPPFTDPETKALAHQNVQSLGYGDRITLVQHFSTEVARHWVEGAFGPGGSRSVGLLFVDDDHSKAGARGAIESWAPHLVPVARIAVDDYGHPDWPGVKEAVDELVAEGLLDPIEIYHDQLAVTQLTEAGIERYQGSTPAAITSEGVSPSPIVAPHAGSVPVRPTEDVDVLAAEWERVDPEGVAALRESAAKLDESTPVGPARTTSYAEAESEVPGISRLAPPLRVVVAAGELPGVDEGTSIIELNIFQLKGLAKARGIKLGARKDKRADMLRALADGE